MDKNKQAKEQAQHLSDDILEGVSGGTGGIPAKCEHKHTSYCTTCGQFTTSFNAFSGTNERRCNHNWWVIPLASSSGNSSAKAL